MQSSPRRIVRAIADALLEIDDAERVQALEEQVSAFVSAAAFATRTTLALALACLRWAPLLLFMSWRPLERLARERRREVLERVERSSFGLVLVPWRTLLLLHFYEDTRELARIGYTGDRKRHLAVIPVPATSGVRLKDDVSGDLHDVRDDEKGAA